jgi:hypothetical protein
MIIFVLFMKCLEIGPCVSNPCVNGGSCTNGVGASYSCSCVAGWTGATCATEINECSSNPCVAANTANCTDILDGFICNCKFGYTGSLCNTPTLGLEYTCNITTGNVATADTTSSVNFTFTGSSGLSTPALLMGTGFALNSVVTSTVYDSTPIGQIVSVNVLLNPATNGWYLTTITCQQQSSPIVHFTFDGWLNKLRSNVTLIAS